MKRWKAVFAATLVTSLAQGLWANAAESDDTPKGTVLFVCEHGNVKSLMAASYFNQRAQARHLPFIAVARGLAPDSTMVPPTIAASLLREGFDVSAFRPVKVNATDVASAKRVVAISLPSRAAIGGEGSQTVVWDDVPAASEDFSAASKSINAHVEAMLTELASTQK